MGGELGLLVLEIGLLWLSLTELVGDNFLRVWPIMVEICDGKVLILFLSLGVFVFSSDNRESGVLILNVIFDIFDIFLSWCVLNDS